MQGLTAGAQRGLQDAGPAQVTPARTGPVPAAGEGRQGQPDIARQALHQPVLAGAQGVEICVLEAMQMAGCHGGVEVDLVFLGLGLRVFAKGLLGRERLAHPGPAFAGLGLPIGAGQQLREQLVRHVGVTEKNLKQLSVYLPVLLAADEHCLQCGAQILSLLQPDRQRRIGRQRNARRVHPHTGPAQGASERGKVVAELAKARVT